MFAGPATSECLVTVFVTGLVTVTDLPFFLTVVFFVVLTVTVFVWKR